MSKKLLLADDSVTIQKVIQITFAHEDYELTVTDNGDAAFEKAKEIQPDLVLADVYMPGKNGYELCSALKQEPSCRTTPVLLLAGSFEPFDEEKARAAKADGWLEKPFESQALIDKVAELLEAAPAAAEAPADTAAAAPQSASPPETPAPASPDVDDWSDVDAFVAADAEEPEPAAAASVETGPGDLAEDFDFADEADAEEITEADDDMFIFEDEPDAEPLPSVAESAPADFGDADEEIMSLDDDDILGAEDLEPLPEEQTLSAWSRDDFAMEEDEDVFAPADEEESFAPVEEETFAPAEEETFAPVEDEAVFVAPEEPAAAEEFVGEVPVAAEPAIAPEEKLSVVDAEASVSETSQAAAAIAASAEDVETRVSALSDAEIEAIVEKVAGRVIEKLAETVLEKIAWEVVPDLAETLIKEEINKIKGAAA